MAIIHEPKALNLLDKAAAHTAQMKYHMQCLPKEVQVQALLKMIELMGNDEQHELLMAHDRIMTTKRNQMVAVYGGNPVDSLAAISTVKAISVNLVHSIDAALAPQLPNLYSFDEMEAISDDVQMHLEDQRIAQRNKALGI